MGPITGVRIVNLRVREKVAYPDLTLDLAGDKGDHLVVGLENGGGKSTLLGAVYHVFVAEADQFLPRRAQRRQGKEGELKRLEHYVPGGDPTHIVVEVEPPTPNGELPMITGPRLLVGACLWKPAGSSPSIPANEFFWSARCVTQELTLRSLGLRGSGGRLLDHREFRAKLKQLRTEVPAAQINIEEGKGAWELHLRNIGIDVEYVRQFLLRMNEDEGAADQVFTYASSRAFLDSLVEVVGDPSAITQVKGRLAEMAGDADAMILDKQRANLLESLVAQTGPLAETMRDLVRRIADRSQTIDRLVASLEDMKVRLEGARHAAALVAERRAELDRTVIEVRNSYNDANARYVLARVQVSNLQVAASAAEVKNTERARDQARADEQVARAAGLLSDRRTAEARIRDIEDVLKIKAVEAEPLRTALSSAVQALDRRLAADCDRLARDRQGASSEAYRATTDLERAGEERSAADKTLGELEGERKGLTTERATLVRQLGTAALSGVLPSADADPAVEAIRARTRAASEKAIAGEHEELRQRALAALQQLSRREQELAGQAAGAEHKVSAARAELSKATDRTDLLCSAITSSGLVEIHPVVLDDHSEAIAQRLQSVIESARLRQAGVAVSAAAAERAATWLREHERLPPRPDIERLCERACADRLGARPGWAYLATLSEDVAASYAAAHPALADGIVVNVPEDLEAVVALATEAREEIDGPVVIGLAAAFNTSGEPDGRVAVVLPHSAHWSIVAGRELIDARSAEAIRWRSEYDRAAATAEAALTLREQLNAWTAEIGPRGLEARRCELQRQEEEVAKIATAQAEVAEATAARIAERDKAEEERDAAREREQDAVLLVQQLEVLTRVAERLKAVDCRFGDIQAAEARAAAAREKALGDIADARQRQGAATGRLEQIATAFGDLTSQRGALVATAAVAVRDGDRIDPSDEAADRQLLAQQVRDRENRWRGAVTDPQLRAQLEMLQADIEGIEKKLRDYSSAIERARALLVADPARSGDDYRDEAEAARSRVEVLAGRVGELKATERQHKEALEKVNEEYRALRRSATLTPEESTEDLDDAAAIRERLRESRDIAMNVRTAREAEQQAAVDQEKVTVARVELLESAVQRLNAGVRRLISGGAIVPIIDLAEVRVDARVVLTERDVPEELLAVLRGAGRPLDDPNAAVALDADRAASSAGLDWVDAHIDALQRALNSLEARAGVALDATEALLRDAAEDVVRGDRVIQTLRAAPRRALADLAAEHHDDIVQRLAAVRHHVASFDARLDALADTVYATIAELLREVRRTVRESQLPNTPAMGRWAGADLLQLSGLDSLKVEQRQAAIATTLRGWFNPERPEDRPREFDSNKVVHGLLSAVTPQFTARILIPSDPLDPEHKPVDHLALETSGGEGVTVALIIASLLASRRASARGHRRTTLLLDNPFAKVTKPEFLRLARDVADELDVQLVAFTGIRDLGALTVFPRLTQLRVSRRENANFVVPYDIVDERLQPLLRDGTLFVSPTEWDAARRSDDAATWPLMSAVAVADRGAGKAT